MRVQKVLSSKLRSFPRAKARQAGMFVGLVAVAMMPVTGKALLQQSPRNVPEFLNRLPDVNDQERMRQQQGSQQNIQAVNADRKRQVAEGSAKLLRLATDLKAEVDKSGKDTLSLKAIRKADAIEKLARSIREKMTLTIRSN